MALRAEINEIEGVAILRLGGRSFGSQQDSDSVREAMNQLFSNGKKAILLDLTGCAVFTQFGLWALVAIVEFMFKQGQKLKLLGSTSPAGDLLRMVKLDTVVEIFATEQEALASFRQSQNSLPLSTLRSLQLKLKRIKRKWHIK